MNVGQGVLCIQLQPNGGTWCCEMQQPAFFFVSGNVSQFFSSVKCPFTLVSIISYFLYGYFSPGPHSFTHPLDVDFTGTLF